MNKLKIKFKESFPSRIIEQNDEPQSVEEQALCHLLQDDIQAFEYYKQIIQKKDDFNEKMDIFIDGIKKDIQDLIDFKNTGRRTIIELPLRSYLLKINQSRASTSEEHMNAILEEKTAHLSTKKFFDHRHDEIDTELIDLMKKKRTQNVVSIENFERDLQDLKKLIENFQKNMKTITSRQYLGLKSSCIIENELSFKNKFNFWRRY